MGYERRLWALVTAGGTREPIDDVRKVTNISSGRFGIEIAKALAKAGVQVKLMLGHTAQLHALLQAKELDTPLIEKIPFDSFRDLDEGIQATLHADDGKPDLFFMAAAVSDFSPVVAPGKIKSRDGKPNIDWDVNPKLLANFREQFGVETFIVGFKLLSGVSQDELISVALNQTRKCRINLTLANDLSGLRGKNHPAFMVTPEGGAIPLTGGKENVAQGLVDFVLRRHDVRWFRAVHIRNDQPVEPNERAARLLNFAQKTKLLRDPAGNVSARDGNKIWITPRQVDKSEVGPESLMPVPFDIAGRRNMYFGSENQKPSIDAGVHQLLYDRLSNIDSILHFHEGGLVIPTATTSFPYPCGTVEEADEMCRALTDAAARDEYPGGPFMLRLNHHGYLAGLDKPSAERLHDDWRGVRAEYIDHLKKVGELDLASAVLSGANELRLSPIFNETEIIGVLAERLDRGYTSCYLKKDCRNLGFGELMMDLLIERGCLIGAHPKCEVIEWYHKRGYRSMDCDGDIVVLEPPTRRPDLIRAATACVINPVDLTVLIGRRLTTGWKGMMALPGGHLEPNETALQGALRELKEETGLTLYDQQPRAVRRFYTGTDDGVCGYGVDCHVFHTICSPEPIRTRELDAQWVFLEDAWKFAPMDWATRRMLRELDEKYPNSLR